MRMLDTDSKQLFYMDLILTRPEAKELIDLLEELLQNSDVDLLHFFDEECSGRSNSEVINERIRRFEPKGIDLDKEVPQQTCREIQLQLYSYGDTEAWDGGMRDIIEDVWGVIESLEPPPA